MLEESKRDKDIEEIFLHVKQIKAEQYKLENKREDELDSIKINEEYTKQTLEEISLDNIPPEDVFEIVEPANEFSNEAGESLEEAVSKMKVDIGTMGTCDFCKQEIIFEQNLSGLVIRNRFFTCEKCCQDASKDELMKWTKSKMANSKEVRPIALWLMQNKNRTRLFEK